ncbi:hypothetical protein [Dysgonomonas sp. BGC7]|nr:hypothetical protein [Dysgonomonas sp. BGC7]
MRNSNNEIVARIDGETGAALFAKGKATFNKDGNIKLKDANIEAMEGSFKKLTAVDADGNNTDCYINFDGSVQKMTFVGDMQHLGVNTSGRPWRFMSNNIWCRASFGHQMTNTVYVNNSTAFLLVNGSTDGAVNVNLSSVIYNGKTVYYIPLFGNTGDAAGFPVDLVVIETTGSTEYNYTFTGGSLTKMITLVNSNDLLSTHIFIDGADHEINGGVVTSFVKVNGLRNPIGNDSKIGYGWLRGPSNDNDWS